MVPICRSHLVTYNYQSLSYDVALPPKLRLIRFLSGQQYKSLDDRRKKRQYLKQRICVERRSELGVVFGYHGSTARSVNFSLKVINALKTLCFFKI
jgi:hypothetical protein